MRPISLPESEYGHAAPITHVAYAPHAPLLASSSYDGSVIIWAREAGGLRPTSRIRHRRLVNSATWSEQHPGLIATASADKTIGVWRIGASGDVTNLGHLARHTDDVNAVAWLPDGERLVSASEDSTAMMWNASDGRFLGTLSSHSGHCMGIAVSPLGVVLTIGEDGAVFAAEPDRSSKLRSRHFTTSIEGCTWSPDGTSAVLACDDGVVRVISPELDLLEEHAVASSAARSVAFAGDGSGRLLVGSYDASVRLLDGPVVDSVVIGGRMWPRSVDARDDEVAVGSFGSSPVVLELEGLKVSSDGGPDTDAPNSIASSDGQLALGLDSGLVVTLSRQSLLSGSPSGARAHRVGRDPVLAVARCAGGWLASSYGGSVSRLETSTSIARTVGKLQLGAPVPSLATQRLSHLALAGTYGGDVAVMDLSGASLTLQDLHAVHEGSVKALAWHSESLAVSAATDCAVRCIRPDGSARTLWYHGNLVNAVATDHRGLVASASRDRLVRLGSLDGPEGLLERPVDLLGGDESMKAVALLDGGDRTCVLGGSYDFALYSWQLDPSGDLPDSRVGEVVLEFGQAVSAMATLGRTSAIVASWDGTVRLVELRKDGLWVGPPLRTEEIVAEAVHDPFEEEEEQPSVVA